MKIALPLAHESSQSPPPSSPSPSSSTLRSLFEIPSNPTTQPAGPPTPNLHRRIPLPPPLPPPPPPNPTPRSLPRLILTSASPRVPPLLPPPQGPLRLENRYFDLMLLPVSLCVVSAFSARRIGRVGSRGWAGHAGRVVRANGVLVLHGSRDLLFVIWLM
ncbi:hypothetical protein Scep_005249 [Stephania cephalantha]|uniref:Uncharacterized protein n=1 Tax=Stephania cephalantha TaxID=152367 RepID=A0AAP0KUV6_9MAGN